MKIRKSTSLFGNGYNGYDEFSISVSLSLSPIISYQCLIKRTNCKDLTHASTLASIRNSLSIQWYSLAIGSSILHTQRGNLDTSYRPTKHTSCTSFDSSSGPCSHVFTHCLLGRVES